MFAFAEKIQGATAGSGGRFDFYQAAIEQVKEQWCPLSLLHRFIPEQIGKGFFVFDRFVDFFLQVEFQRHALGQHQFELRVAQTFLLLYEYRFIDKARLFQMFELVKQGYAFHYRGLQAFLHRAHFGAHARFKYKSAPPPGNQLLNGGITTAARGLCVFGNAVFKVNMTNSRVAHYF